MYSWCWTVLSGGIDWVSLLPWGGQSWLLLARVPLRDGVSGKLVNRGLRTGPHPTSGFLWLHWCPRPPSSWSDGTQLWGAGLVSGAGPGLSTLEKAGLVPRDLSRTWRWSSDPSRIGRVRTETHAQVEGHALCARTSSSQPWVGTRRVLSRTRTLC